MRVQRDVTKTRLDEIWTIKSALECTLLSVARTISRHAFIASRSSCRDTYRLDPYTPLLRLLALKCGRYLALTLICYTSCLLYLRLEAKAVLMYESWCTNHDVQIVMYETIRRSNLPIVLHQR